MPGYLIHVGISAACPHQGQAQVIPGNARVKLGGQPAATTADQTLIMGCPFVPVKPMPCLRVQWTMPSTRIKIGGNPALLDASQGLCLSPEQAPQGSLQISQTQTKVKGK